MNNLGQRIKEYRKKNDLTQEKLADYLGVTYQSVSKWETGMTMPDLALIVPMARLLGVTTDELLGKEDAATDARKAYFDREYHDFWMKDHKQDLEIARMAVKEYPADYRYWQWLAENEWYVGSDADYVLQDGKYVIPDEAKQLLWDSARHHQMIIDDCPDAALRNDSIAGLVYVYNDLSENAEARKYAAMYPEAHVYTRDELLAICVGGKELADVRKKIVYKNLSRLLHNMDLLRTAIDDRAAVLDAEETIIKAVITDGNYYGFHHTLSFLCYDRAELAMKAGDCEQAFAMLKRAISHAKGFDEAEVQGKVTYTCPILCGYEEDYSERRKTDPLADYFIDCAKEKAIFAPLREREDYKALFVI